MKLKGGDEMDMEKVIKGLRCIKGDLILCVDCAYSDGNGHGTYSCKAFCANDAIALLKKQEEQRFFVDESGKITPLPVVVRCKDCVFGKREKNDSTGMTWIYCGHHRENRPEEWFCSSGSRI